MKKDRNAKKKKILIGCLACAGAVILLAALLFFIPRRNARFSWDCFRARAAVSSYLKNVKAGNFAEAAELVSFTSVDGRELPSDEENRQRWISRIQDLRQGIKQNYLLDYSDLSVVKVDGEMQVSVTLNVSIQGGGDKLSSGTTSVFIKKVDGDWRIVSVSEYEYEKKSQYERALSGILPAEE